GATTGILILNTGVMLTLWFFPVELHRLVMLQFVLLIVSLTGLSLGSLIAERAQSQWEAEKSEERVRLLLDSTEEAIYGLDMIGSAFSPIRRACACWDMPVRTIYWE